MEGSNHGATDTNSSISIIESQLDWLTVTAPHDNGADMLVAFGQKLLENQAQHEYRKTPFHFKGYVGYHAGAVTYGDRPDGALVQVSGHAASEVCVELAALARNCTRLDCQVTASLIGDGRNFASQGYQEGVNHVAKGGRPTGYTYYNNSSGGSTLYVGSRSSAMFGRLYNKSAESGLEQYADCWRWEVELKPPYAMDFLANYVGSKNAASLVAGFVHSWFRRHGVYPPWNVDTECQLKPPPTPPTDVDTSLKWLHNQVKPSVDRLRANGHVEPVLQALGLDDLPAMANYLEHFYTVGHHRNELASDA